jgi:hypothetical protein
MISLSVSSRQPAQLPWSTERLVHKCAIALGMVIDESTLSNYTSALNSYITFCRLHDRPIEPTRDTLSFLHCLHVPSHQARLSQHLFVWNLQPTRNVLP